MDQKIAQQIFLHYELGDITSFQKIEIGWTNKVGSSLEDSLALC